MVGNTYRIVSVGTVDFTALGADSNDKGEIFVAEAVPTKVSASDLVQNGSIQEVKLVDKLTSTNIKFSGTETVTWSPEYVASVSRNYDANNRQYTDAEKPEDRIYVKRAVSTFDPRSKTIERRGSILYTKNLLDDHIADKITLKTKSLKRQINEQIQRLERLIRRLKNLDILTVWAMEQVQNCL